MNGFLVFGLESFDYKAPTIFILEYSTVPGLYYMQESIQNGIGFISPVICWKEFINEQILILWNNL